MLFLLSPAKSLDFDTPVGEVAPSKPLFVKQSAELIELLRQKSPPQVAELMDLSDSLALLNVPRYQTWRPKFTAKNSRPAVFAFNGNVYAALDVRSLAPPEVNWLQDHLCILSGLYGVLRPLDSMQPYRLEMGTALENARGVNLYKFWGTQISDYLNRRLGEQATPVLVNLASREYFKAVDLKAIKARVVECVFEEYRGGGQYKVLALHAKRARGLMARYAAQHALTFPEQLAAFNLEGYAFAPAASSPQRMVFRRHPL